MDTVIIQLDERFAPITSKAMGLLYLLPEKIASHTLADLKRKLSESEFYQSLLPNPLLFWTELVLYKSNLEMRGSKAIPTNLDEALQEIKPSIFSNLFTMLKVVKTLPVSSCEAERSFSTLRRLNTC